MMKRILSLLTALTLLIGCAGAVAEAAPAEGAHQIESRTVPVIVPNRGEIPGEACGTGGRRERSERS